MTINKSLVVHYNRFSFIYYKTLLVKYLVSNGGYHEALCIFRH
nr:MAG TPA: hypothetical protein [Inoviridae sp.]